MRPPDARSSRDSGATHDDGVVVDMRAVIVEQFGPVDRAVVREVQDPTPGAGEVIVDVRFADTNFPDILVTEGAYQFKPPLPFSPGKAGAGVVAALGDGVTTLAVGERVAFQLEYGAYVEKAVVPAATCYPIPDDMTFETATAISFTNQTAYFALLDRASFQAGDSVLVLGASGAVGLACVELAKAMGAGTVIGGARGPEKAALVKEAGADACVDLTTDNLRDGLRDAVGVVTGGRGVDIVIDPVGGAAQEAAMRALAWRGRLVVVGFASGDIAAIKSNYLLVKNITVSGLQWSDYRDREPAWVARAQQEIFDYCRAGKLRAYIDSKLPLEQFAVALGRIRDGRAQGKILLEVNR